MQKFILWFYALVSTAIAVITKNIDGLIYSILLVCIFMSGDFFVGIWASRKAKKIGVQSSKLRWSTAKYSVYCFFVIATLIIGSFLHIIDSIIEDKDILAKSNILVYTLRFMQVQMIFITWIEAVSIVENFRRVYPDNTFLKGLHYVLVVDVRKKIPKFSNFLKEEKSKDFDNHSNNSNSQSNGNNNS